MHHYLFCGCVVVMLDYVDLVKEAETKQTFILNGFITFSSLL